MIGASTERWRYSHTVILVGVEAELFAAAALTGPGSR